MKVDDICEDIFLADNHGLGIEESFDQMIQRFSFACEHDQRIEQKLGIHCGQCEYICSSNDKTLGKKDGRLECFMRVLGVDT